MSDELRSQPSGYPLPGSAGVHSRTDRGPGNGSPTRRRAWLLLLGLFALPAFAGIVRQPDPAADAQAAMGRASERGHDPRSPSFLHILTDDQTIDSIRYMPRVLRVLRSRGTSFRNHHDVQPLCCPSRASFLTGQYPHNHGVLTNTAPEGGYGAMDLSRTLYTSMQDAGYRTGWIGKILNADHDQGVQPEPGFDDWFVSLRGTELDMFDYEFSDNGVERSYQGEFQNDVIAAEAREFLESTDPEQPFLLTTALTSPHWSYCPREPLVYCSPEADPDDSGRFDGLRFPHREQVPGRRLRRTATGRTRSTPCSRLTGSSVPWSQPCAVAVASRTPT